MSSCLAYRISFIILHAAIYQNTHTLPLETPELLHTLLIVFNRRSEDSSLAFKPRLASRYTNKALPDKTNE